MNDHPAPTFKICPRCGAGFECLHATDCWCMQYQVSPENLAAIMQLYDNCLCPGCLSLFAEKKGNTGEPALQ